MSGFGMVNAASGLNTNDEFRQNDSLDRTDAPAFSDYTKLHNNDARGANTTDQLHQHNKLGHTGAWPSLSDRTQQCIEFLSTITRVEVIDKANQGAPKEILEKVKDAMRDSEYVINTFIADVNGQQSNATSSSFQIQRTFPEFQELQHTVEHWSKQHERKGCGYCPFFQSADLPGAISRMTTSTDKLELELQDFLYSYIVNARRPQPSEMDCKGYNNIPSILTQFLTKAVPATVTDMLP